MAYCELDGLKETRKLWNEVKDGDIVAVRVSGINIQPKTMGKKVQHVTVGEPKRNAVVGFGGYVTLHFGPGEQPVAYLDAYDESKKVYVTVYE